MRSLNSIATHWRDIQETVHSAQLHSVHCTISSVIRGIFRLLHISGHQAGGSLTNADLFSELMMM